MSDKNQRVTVRILDKEYQVACKAGEREALLTAAAELDQRMRLVRNSAALIGADRIAVMVALNLCHELQQTRRDQPQAQPVDTTALARLVSKLDLALQR